MRRFYRMSLSSVKPDRLLDGHHLSCALLEEGVDEVFISPVEDLSHLNQAEFWRVMARRNLIYPYAQGRRHGFAASA